MNSPEQPFNQPFHPNNDYDDDNISDTSTSSSIYEVMDISYDSNNINIQNTVSDELLSRTDENGFELSFEEYYYHFHIDNALKHYKMALYIQTNLYKQDHRYTSQLWQQDTFTILCSLHQLH